MSRAAWVVALALCACGEPFKLDGFLYQRERTEAYVFEPEGPDEWSTVSADRIEPVAPIPVGDGDQLGAVYVRANVTPPRAYALFFHGNGPHLGGQFEWIKRIANMGYDVLAFDYRGWGTSTDVEVSPQTVAADTRAARAYLVDRLGGDERLFYYGHSFGTAAVTELSMEHPPKVLVLEAAFASIEDFKSDASLMDFPWEYIAKDDWPTATRIASVNTQLLSLHGAEDDFVRPEFGKKVFDNALNPTGQNRWVLVPGAAHEVGPTLGGEHGEITRAFVDQFIPPP